MKSKATYTLLVLEQHKKLLDYVEILTKEVARLREDHDEIRKAVNTLASVAGQTTRQIEYLSNKI